MANPIRGSIQGGAHVIAGQSSDRKTALALVLAIAAAEMLLSGQLQAIWKALWGPARDLHGNTAASVGSVAAGIAKVAQAGQTPTQTAGGTK